MVELNLTAANKQEELVKAYLQENASRTLADKINHGTPFEKDGQMLTNKKTLSGFMKYACDEAKKLARQGATAACIDSDTVFGWAVHYFEEDSIEGTLYMRNGEEYKPAQKTTKSILKPPVTKKYEQPNERQFSIFHMTDDPPTQEEPKAEEIPATNKPQVSPLYQQYTEIQNQYPDCIVAYRIGDFYEIFGDNAVTISSALNLTLAKRDFGSESRVPMVGFPYNVADVYIAKLIDKGYQVAVAESPSDIKIITDDRSSDEMAEENMTEAEMRKFDGDIEEPTDPFAEETELAKHFDFDVMYDLGILLGNTFIVG